MRDPNRIPRILNLLRAYWEENPDLRLGQIVVNLTPDQNHISVLCARDTDYPFETDMANPFYVEDDEWEQALRNELLKKYEEPAVKPTATCQRSNCMEDAEPGLCPYDADVNNEDVECNCCSGCRRSCADDI